MREERRSGGKVGTEGQREEARDRGTEGEGSGGTRRL